ncbi:MAG: hypothetical protein LW630_07645 [Saprospiraceae bacterium]|nr:hypothetical protein [Saprospiraceae bacterium]
MNKLMIAFFLISMNGIITAQQQYTWEEYGISFSLADDFVEKKNDATEFSADGDGMSLSIIPFKDASIDQEDITGFVMEAAASMELDRVDDVSTIEINGFQGGYAEGVQDGVNVFMMGLIDPDSETNFFVIIAFLEGDGNAIDEGIEICRSIQKL